MNANQAQPQNLNHCQQRVADLEAEVERLRQENQGLHRANHLQPSSIDSGYTHSHWLSTTATVANLLLRSSDYTTVLPDVVRLLGEAVGSERCCLTQSLLDSHSSEIAVRLLTEWSRMGVASSTECIPELEAGIENAIFSGFHERVLQGKVANFLVNDLPEPSQSLFAAQGNTSMLIVPIMVQGKCWGQIGFDNCSKAQLYDEAEIAILQVAAESIAVAIARQAQDDALREAEQERNRLLSTVAQVANLLLRSPDYTIVLPDVVRLLGEVVGSDQCAIGQSIPHPISGFPAARLPSKWDWCKTGVLPSEEFSPHSDQLFLWGDAPYIYSKLLQDEVINCLVADLPEPDHSLLSAQGNTAELFVPILVNHQCWGFIAFDNCCEARLYNEAEIAILKVAADSIAAAIERQAKDEELLRLERKRSQELVTINAELQQTLDRLAKRDQLLEATATAAN